MSGKPKIVCVVPSIRPDSMSKFREAWRELFEKHQVTLITVWDGETPRVEIWTHGDLVPTGVDYFNVLEHNWIKPHRDLFCRYTDACRNIGFACAAGLKDRFTPDYVLTLDDDVYPSDPDVDEFFPNDPIQDHIDCLNKKVCLSWMNTAHNGSPSLRGMPYENREEAPVMLSHGVWTGTPDFDGETQLQLEATVGIPYTLHYYIGPIPRGVMFPLCGMNVMVRKEALPYLYFAPMGPDSGVKGLNRFSDIWMGVFLKREFDRLGWACYTGGSVVHHSRASDAKKNYEQEKLGRQWNEAFGQGVPPEAVVGTLGKSPEFIQYFQSYADKRQRYADLIRSLQEGGAK